MLRIVNIVILVFVILSLNYVRFLCDDRSINDIILGFFCIFNFFNVIGVIDGIYIFIKVLKDDEYFFVNWKFFYFINVMVVCDVSLKFINLVVRWFGLLYDVFVWINFMLCDLFESGGMNRGWLFGDSVYFLKKYLLIFVMNLSNFYEEVYNEVYIRMRNIIERSFGVLKMCFCCIDYFGGIFFFYLLRVCWIIIVCVVLYNMCIDNYVLVLCL